MEVRSILDKACNAVHVRLFETVEYVFMIHKVNYRFYMICVCGGAQMDSPKSYDCHVTTWDYFSKKLFFPYSLYRVENYFPNGK